MGQLHPALRCLGKGAFRNGMLKGLRGSGQFKGVSPVAQQFAPEDLSNRCLILSETDCRQNRNMREYA
jgi:hypothetical protein